MKKILGRLLKIYALLIVAFLICGQIFQGQKFLSKANVVCKSGICTVSNSSLNGYVFEQLSFEQTAFRDMWLKSSSRNGYKIWSERDKITECLQCGDKNLIFLPFSWYRKANAEAFLAQAVSGNDFEYSQSCKILCDFLYLLGFTTLLVMLLYVVDVIK